MNSKVKFGIVFRDSVRQFWIGVLIGGLVGAIGCNAFLVHRAGEEWWLMFSWSIIPLFIGYPLGFLIIALGRYVKLRMKNG